MENVRILLIRWYFLHISTFLSCREDILRGCLVDPDGRRSLATDLGAASFLPPDYLRDHQVVCPSNHQQVHWSPSLVFVSGYYRLVSSLGRFACALWVSLGVSGLLIDPSWLMARTIIVPVGIYLLEMRLFEATDSPGRPCDILQWWKMFEPNFPMLAKSAKMIFAIPASSAKQSEHSPKLEEW